MSIKSFGLKAALLSSVVFLAACDSGNNTPAASSGAEEQAANEQMVESEEAMIARAMDIHERIITLDTHDDIDRANFTDELNYTMDTYSQVNLPKMYKGGLDVAFFIVFTSQGELNEAGFKEAYDTAISKFNAIHWLAKEKAPSQIGLALTSDDVRRLNAEGKKIAMIGIENGYPMGTDLGNIKKFADLGARYMSLAHNGHSQLADSNTGERVDENGNPTEPWLYNGLSELGKQAIVELNKHGIMIDISHPSYEANKQTIALSKAPVIASHSSARALSSAVSRNLEDDLLLAVKENGGVIQTVAFSSYLDRDKHNAHQELKDKLYADVAARMGFEILDYDTRQNMTPDALAAYRETYDQLVEMAAPRLESEVNTVAPPVDVKDFVDHIDYMVDMIGLDHVGISSDFDGGGGVEGWNDASETHNVTIELVRRGYTEEQIAQLWGGNLLRVLDDVQEVSRQLLAAEGE
ncbi:dipeptidase [Pseudemcibacter aquimaris]|uniref:dipeptidase n=1 Tax=Pseudemcibacter aquimaris TaxID=2857064 RepID=UPI0020135D27|nr:dipeptidase [Pseudemcibacter aquimaris]MCC3860503.1 dipeptidase [Pseudemcibacter aquimaris]WDU59328.1 dipeptidase [Pseudemcibacter aquimaris]